MHTKGAETRNHTKRRKNIKEEHLTITDNVAVDKV